MEAAKRDDLVDVRGAVTVGLGFALAGRASELCGLDLERASSSDAGCTYLKSFGTMR